MQGNRITVRADAGPPDPAVLDALVRPLLGRFQPRAGEGARIVLIRASGVRRLDETAAYFRTADRDAVFAFESPR